MCCITPLTFRKNPLPGCQASRSNSKRGKREKGNHTSELLYEGLMVLNGLLQDHLGRIHLPAPLGAYRVSMMPADTRQL